MYCHRWAQTPGPGVCSLKITKYVDPKKFVRWTSSGGRWRVQPQEGGSHPPSTPNYHLCVTTVCNYMYSHEWELPHIYTSMLYNIHTVCMYVPLLADVCTRCKETNFALLNLFFRQPERIGILREQRWCVLNLTGIIWRKKQPPLRNLYTIELAFLLLVYM